MKLNNDVMQKLLVLLIAAVLLIGITAKAQADFVHPGIPLTTSDLDTLKANLNTEPWKSAYTALAADSHSQLTYVMQGPFATVSRTPDVNLSQYDNDMQAVFNLSRMWYFTRNSAYAQKAHDIILAWATTQTSFGGAESYLTIGDYAYRTFGGTDILRGTWPGWTQTDTNTCKTYFNAVYWSPGTAISPLKSANQGAEDLICDMCVAIFEDDQAAFDQCVQAFRADVAGGMADSLPNGELGDTGRDQGHAYGELLHLSLVAEMAWKQGVDLYAEGDNRLLAAGELYARQNLGVSTPFMEFGTPYNLFFSFGSAPNASPQPPDALNMIYSAYVTRKGLSAPYLSAYRDTLAETSDTFTWRKSADSSTAAALLPLVYPATSSVTTGLTSTAIGGAAPSGSANYSGGTWTVAGGGSDIYGTTDSFQFAYVPMTGDCAIIAKVTSQQNTSTNARTGVMIRETLAPTSSMMAVWAKPLPIIEAFWRGQTAYSTNNQVSGDAQEAHEINSLPYWVKLVRVGNRITGFHSPDGVSWCPIQEVDFTMGSVVYVGLCVCSHANGTLNTSTFTNVRITHGDNSEALQLPVAPYAVYGSPGDRQVPLRWLESFGATSYNVKRAIVSGGPYTTIAGVSGLSYVDTTVTNGTTYYYVVTANNSVGESSNSLEDTVTPPLQLQKLSGATIGTTGSYNNNAAATRAAALDIDYATYFDAPTASGSWVGLDLGSPQVIAQVRYIPRVGDETRMVGGMFQASNTADFSSGVVTLATVPSTPPDFIYTKLVSTDSGTYRYVRYLGPASGQCNVAEVEFYTPIKSATVAGIVTLPNRIATAPQPVLTFTLTPTGSTAGPVTTQPVTPAADGSFTLPAFPVGTYTIGVKGAQWLKKDINVSTLAGPVTGLSIALLAGDLNGDNQVAGADLAMVRAAYGSVAANGSTPASSNWNPLCDLNGDGSVSATDLLMVRANYGKLGDP